MSIAPPSSASLALRACLRRAQWVLAATALAACASGPAADAPATPVSGLRLIGTAAILPGTEVLGSVFGGISGIDYDALHDRWLLISDDRSMHDPARIYTMRLAYTAAGLEPPAITGVFPLRQPGGAPYPSPRHPTPGVDVPDAEAVRWLPDGQRFLWTSEGDFARGFGPQLRENLADGSAVRDLPLPPAFQPTPGAGPRSNGSLEGLALTPDGRTAWLAMELPWRQDGPAATPDSPGAPVRITAIDIGSAHPLRQIAYAPDAVPHARRLPWGPQMNGVSEILADGPHHLLVLERAYSTGAGSSARLYRIDTRSASNTLRLPALAPGNHTVAAKTLVADLDSLGAGTLDNLEGMAWGPPLPDGSRVIVLVSDDNFNPAQVTQFIAVQYRAPDPQGHGESGTTDTP